MSDMQFIIRVLCNADTHTTNRTNGMIRRDEWTLGELMDYIKQINGLWGV